MSEHGHVGVDLPVSGRQGPRRVARPSRRGAAGPRPVRLPALPVSVRPDTGPAVCRPATETGGLDVGGPYVDGLDVDGVGSGGVDVGRFDRWGAVARPFGSPAAMDAAHDVGWSA